MESQTILVKDFALSVFIIILFLTSIWYFILFFFKHSDTYDKIKLIKRLNGLFRNKIALYPPAKYVKRCISIRVFFPISFLKLHTRKISMHLQQHVGFSRNVVLNWITWLFLLTTFFFFWTMGWSVSMQTGFLLDETNWKHLLWEMMCAQSVKAD